MCGRREENREGEWEETKLVDTRTHARTHGRTHAHTRINTQGTYIDKHLTKISRE